MMNERNDNPGQGQWRQENEEYAENDKRGIDNPELNRDQDSSFDQDRDFDTENEDEDENDDFLTNGLDDDDEESLTDDEDYDEDPQETKENQQRTGTDTNPDSYLP